MRPTRLSILCLGRRRTPSCIVVFACVSKATYEREVKLSVVGTDPLLTATVLITEVCATYTRFNVPMQFSSYQYLLIILVTNLSEMHTELRASLESLERVVCDAGEHVHILVAPPPCIKKLI